MSGANRRVIHPFLFTWESAYLTQLLYQESSLPRTVNITFASGIALKSVSHSRFPGLKWLRLIMWILHYWLYGLVFGGNIINSPTDRYSY